MSKQRIVASTKVYSDECIYTWIIENYRLLKFEVGEELVSPKFGIGRDNKKYFNLELYPAGENKEAAGFISLFLTPVIDSTKKPNKLVCRWTFSVINDKKVVLKSAYHYDFASDRSFVGYGSTTFCKLENIDKLISSKNTLIIQCELEILDQIQSSDIIICSKDETVDTIKFDFSFHSEKLSDVKLIVEEQEIPAHKIVLAAVSPVFRAMFTHDMLENEENSVKITDTHENIVTAMLQFIYTGKVDATETNKIIELLAVADKYQIDSLKIKCGKMLCADLSSENAIDILVAAHKYKLKNLEDETLKFVTTHTHLLSNSENMKKIDDHDIWVNVTQSIVKSQKNVS